MSDHNAWSGNDSQGHDLPDLSMLRETIVFDVPTQTRADRMRIDGRNPIRKKYTRENWFLVFIFSIDPLFLEKL